MPRNTNKETTASQKSASVAATRPTRTAKTKAYSSAGWAAPKQNRKRTISQSNPSAAAHQDGPVRKTKKGSPPEPQSISAQRPVSRKPQRKLPPPINVDNDNSGNESEDATSDRMNGSSGTKPSGNQASVEESSQPSGTDDDSNRESDEQHESQEEADLAHLDKEDLRKQLSSERPQWNYRSQSRSSNDVLDHDDHEESFAEHEPGTTASEFDGQFDIHDDEEDEEMEIADDELEESEPEIKSTKVASKRGKSRLSEVPQWKNKVVTATWRSKNHANFYRRARSTVAAQAPDREEEESDSDGDRRPSSDYKVNDGWPKEAHYIPVPPGSRTISIKGQPTPMRRMIRNSINHVTGNFLFESGYPAINQAEFETFHRDVFLLCAKRLGYREIIKRLKDDYELVKQCACLINARISLLRTNAKGFTDTKVEGFYQLVTGTEAEKRVKELTDEDQNYIYPVVHGTIDTNRPYYNNCIISSIKEAFFTGNRGTLSQKYQSRFKSIISEGPRKNEMELPIAMVSVIATSVHASLDDWSQGYKRTKSNFRADAYESVYRGHELFLTMLKDDRPDFFHTLMSGLYNAVAGSQGARSATHIATRCMARLNLPPLNPPVPSANPPLLPVNPPLLPADD